MTTKKYNAPAIEVVNLQADTALLNGSQGDVPQLGEEPSMGIKADQLTRGGGWSSEGWSSSNE